MVARRENIYYMKLKQKINYVNLTTAELNYKSSMTKLLAINSIMQQNSDEATKSNTTKATVHQIL